jgi:cold shock CspA family protein
MTEGVVKWFNGEKGHGVIALLAYGPNDAIQVDDHDIHVHYGPFSRSSGRVRVV